MATTPMRILIAEDETIIRLDLRELLERSGFDVVAEARDGEEAVALARSEAPDLALLDVKMPKLDGIDAARRILDERPIPIVMVTAYGEQELVARAVEAGVFGYLVKPFRESDLLPAITTARARHEELVALREEADSLAEALAARKAIERAKGLLMEREGLTEQDAFARLRKASQISGRPLKVVAEALIATLDLSAKSGSAGADPDRGRSRLRRQIPDAACFAAVRTELRTPPAGGRPRGGGVPGAWPTRRRGGAPAERRRPRSRARRPPPTPGRRAPCRAHGRAVSRAPRRPWLRSVRSSSWIVALRATSAVDDRLARRSRSCASAWARRSSRRARSAAVSAFAIAAVSAATCARTCSSWRSSVSSDSWRSSIWTLCATILPSPESRVTASAARADGTLRVRAAAPSVPVAYCTETT